jgi:hypothetical protein
LVDEILAQKEHEQARNLIEVKARAYFFDLDGSPIFWLPLSAHLKLLHTFLLLDIGIFKKYHVFSQQRCKVMFQALMRVAYSILVSKFMPEVGHQKKQLPRNAREKNENSDIEEEESVEQFEVGGKRKPKDRGSVEIEEICSSLDLNQISGLFMLFLSQDFINQNALEKIKVKDNFF